MSEFRGRFDRLFLGEEEDRSFSKTQETGLISAGARSWGRSKREAIQIKRHERRGEAGYAG